MKVRVYELAKEAGMDSKVLADKLKDLGYDVKAYSSALDEATAEEIRKRLTSTHTEIQKKRIQTKGKTTIIRRRTRAVRNLQLPPDADEPTPEIELGHGEENNTEQAPILAPISTQTDETAPVDSKEAVAEEHIEEVPAETAEQENQPAAAEDEGEAEEAISADTTPEETELSPVESENKEKAEPAKASSKKKTEAPARKGLARVIKRAAIKIPVEEKKPARPYAKKTTKPRPKKAAPKAAPQSPNANQARPNNDKEPAGGKGKKGKRFVKFHHHNEPGARNKKTSKRKGFAVVDMEDVAMAGGRFSSALKVGRGNRSGSKKQKHGDVEIGQTKAIKRRIRIFGSITIGELAHKMGAKANEVIAKLMSLGVMATVNQSLDLDTATLVSADFGYEVEQAHTEEISVTNLDEKESGGELLPRPPVVTVMGHVDHGKTSILDAIRNTDVAEGEAGGITQHIGAHYVHSPQGDVVFLDTPGHAAFTEMRSRGAKVTDVVVLVVAADDGVMEQTKEAINHAKAAEVPIVVAVNKIDKDGADPMRVKRELAEFDLVPEDWGGSTIFCEVSAKQGTGIDDLLEQIILQAEILELKADPERKAKGRVIEAHLHKGRGPVATILIQEGTLQAGQAFVVGNYYGKIRALYSDKGEQVKKATPSTPVEIHGLSGVPMSGDEFFVLGDEKLAKNVSNQRQMKSREAQLGQATKISLDNLFDKLKEGEIKELCVLLRADVQGTLEAFGKALEKLGTDAVKVKIIHEGTGTITDSDILLASASNAIIIGFNVRPSLKVKDFANIENVDIRFYDVIYHALDDIRSAMTGLLDPTFDERVIGTLDVRDTFSVPKIGTIAGCHVSDGKVERSAKVRLLREGVVVYTGNISSLRRFKDDVKEVQNGYECGVGIENYNDIKAGDTLEAFVFDEVAGVL